MAGQLVLLNGIVSHHVVNLSFNIACERATDSYSSWYVPNKYNSNSLSAVCSKDGRSPLEVQPLSLICECRFY